jgi:hypothetical protein
MKVPVNWKQIDKFSQTMFTLDIPTVGKHMRIVELMPSYIILHKEHLIWAIWQSVIYTISLFGITKHNLI